MFHGEAPYFHWAIFKSYVMLVIIYQRVSIEFSRFFMIFLSSTRKFRHKMPLRKRILSRFSMEYLFAFLPRDAKELTQVLAPWPPWWSLVMVVGIPGDLRLESGV